MLVNIADDFDLEKIKNSGQCFRVNKVSDYYRFICQDKYLYIKQCDKNTYEISCSKKTWNDFWFNYFDLDRNYKNIRKNIKSDDIYLKKACNSSKGIRILRQDPLEVILSFIISQRRSIPSITSSVEKLCFRFGQQVKTPYETINLFPDIQTLSKCTLSDFSKLGVGYRDKYLVDAVNKIYYKEINLERLYDYNDFELLNELSTINGVGEKVANCIALFAYNRVNLAPVDVWIKRVIDNKYNGKNPFEKYKKNAGIIQQFFFYYARNIDPNFTT